MGTIRFSYADRKSIPIKNKTQVKALIQKLFEREKKELSFLQYIFCSDDYLLQINRDYLNHDYYTDIITFDLSEGSATVGEVYISADRVKDNAATLREPIKREMLRVLIHGALHLCGYKDKTKREITYMREKEGEYLRLFEETF